MTRFVSALAPSFAWRELFLSDKRHERLYFFPGWEKWVIISHFEKPIWPPNGNKNRNREYVIENLPHEAPGAPKIFRFERLNIFIIYSGFIWIMFLKRLPIWSCDAQIIIFAMLVKAMDMNIRYNLFSVTKVIKTKPASIIENAIKRIIAVP